MARRTTKADIEALLVSINSAIPAENRRVALESRCGVNVIVLYKAGLPVKVMLAGETTGQMYAFLDAFAEGMSVMQ